MQVDLTACSPVLQGQLKEIPQWVKPSDSAAFGCVVFAERGVLPLKCHFVLSRALGLDFNFGRHTSSV